MQGLEARPVHRFCVWCVCAKKEAMQSRETQKRVVLIHLFCEG